MILGVFGILHYWVGASTMLGCSMGVSAWVFPPRCFHMGALVFPRGCFT